MMKRFAVYIANQGFVTYKAVCSQDAQAVFYRKADAELVARTSGGEVVPVVLWYGPHAPGERDWPA